MPIYFANHYEVSFFALAIALVLDHILGEPKRLHPLVGFGNVASLLERKLNPNNPTSSQKSTFPASFYGLIAWALACGIPAGIIFLIISKFDSLIFELLSSIILLNLCIGRCSLIEHVLSVQNALKNKEIFTSRRELSKIVSRETEKLNDKKVTQATIETCLENNADAIMAPIFWYLIFGPVAVVFYRLTNTLDAMWGYKNKRYNEFGVVAAKTDDFLNYIPARLLAFTSALVGNFKLAIKSWKNQAPECESPNAGPVMAAGAGAIERELGGGAFYEGNYIEKPILGYGNPPEPDDISKAIHHINKTLMVWMIFLGVTTIFMMWNHAK